MGPSEFVPGRLFRDPGYAITILCGVVFAQGLAAAARMPQGAYLINPVTNVQSLTKQFDKNKMVRYRYARTFNMSIASVRAAFAQLKLHRLTEDHIYEVHFVRPGETVGYKLRRVRKGTWIYMMPDGTPALAQVCGNPLRKSALLGTVVSRARSVAPSTIPEFTPTENLMPAVTPFPPPLRNIAVAKPPVDTPATGIAPPSLGFIESPDIVPVENVPPAPQLPRPLLYRSANTQLAQWLGHGSSFPFGFAAAALPLLGFAGGSSHHSSPPVPGVPIPVVPEGSAFLMLLGGGVPLLIAWRYGAGRRQKV